MRFLLSGSRKMHTSMMNTLDQVDPEVSFGQQMIRSTNLNKKKQSKSIQFNSTYIDSIYRLTYTFT